MASEDKKPHSEIHLTPERNGDMGMLEFVPSLLRRWKLLFLISILGGVIGYVGSFLIAPTYIAKTTFLPPQQQQSAAASALASLGSLASIAGGAGGIKAPGDQYVALMQSVTISDLIVDRFALMDAYEAKLRVDARRKLSERVQISLGKKDGLISVTVEDTDPKRVADIANQYVAELRTLNAKLALTEAQQRRTFFEKHWHDAKQKLTEAQLSLEQSGFNSGALKAEPKSAAEAYAKTKAEISAAEIKLRALRTTLTDNTPEIQVLSSTIQALRQRLADLELSSVQTNDKQADYIGRYREFKYQETLFELMAKQFELARVDEGREGALIQVIDPAQAAERKHKPKRSVIALAGSMAALFVASLLLIIRTKRPRNLAPSQ